jgi:hypothetical protein
MLVAATLAAAAAAAGGCAHDQSRSARAQLQQTFGPRGAIASGMIDLAFAVTARGAGVRHRAGESLALRVRGAFESLGPARLPRFALRLEASSPATGAPADVLRAGATAIGGRLFIELGGRQFLAPDAALQALRRGYLEATGGASASRRPGVAALGLDPEAWLTHPRIAGAGRLAGVQVTHIRAGVDAVRLIADARKLAVAGRALGIGLPARSEALAVPPGAVRAARADLYAGTRDHRLRRLALSVAIVPIASARTTAWAGGATLSLTIALSGLDQPQRILAPHRPRSLSQLPAALAPLGLTPDRRG